MASIREQIWLPRDAAAVWRVVGDPAGIAQWFPGIAACSMDDMIRTCHLARGGEVVEEIVTLDHDLHRLQYRVLRGIPVSHHLATVDVIADGLGRCLVVYGTDIEPDHLAAALASSIHTGLWGLARQLAPESG
jgi:Polyketide cyclase / dehydrase and lipid transport